MRWLKNKSLRRGGYLGIVAAVCLICGCSQGPKSNADRPAVGHVAGKVTYQGQPLKNAIVKFHPQNAGDSGTGQTQEDGQFEITTYAPQDGAVLGLHSVTIEVLPSAPAVPGVAPSANESPISKKYRSPETTPLTAEVKESDNHFEWEVK